jgi:hypothetical protein
MEFGGIRLSISGVLSKHLPDGYEKNHEKLRIAGDQTKIPARHLRNISPEGYRCTRHFGLTSLSFTSNIRTRQK